MFESFFPQSLNELAVELLGPQTYKTWFHSPRFNTLKTKKFTTTNLSSYIIESEVILEISHVHHCFSSLILDWVKNPSSPSIPSIPSTPPLAGRSGTSPRPPIFWWKKVVIPMGVYPMMMPLKTSSTQTMPS